MTSLDMKRNKTLDYKSDIIEKNNQYDQNEVLIDEGYKKWLEIGGQQHSTANYRLYLEDMKNIASKMNKLPTEREKEDKAKIALESKLRMEEAMSSLSSLIDDLENSNIEEESHSVRR